MRVVVPLLSWIYGLGNNSRLRPMPWLCSLCTCYAQYSAGGTSIGRPSHAYYDSSSSQPRAVVVVSCFVSPATTNRSPERKQSQKAVEPREPSRLRQPHTRHTSCRALQRAHPFQKPDAPLVKPSTSEPSGNGVETVCVVSCFALPELAAAAFA